MTPDNEEPSAASGGYAGVEETTMDIERAYLQAMFQATDDWILRGGPYPNDEAIAKIDPRLAAFVDACNSPDDDDSDGDE